MSNFNQAAYYVKKDENGHIPDILELSDSEKDVLTFGIHLDIMPMCDQIEAMEFIAMTGDQREEFYSSLHLLVSDAIRIHNDKIDIAPPRAYHPDNAMEDAGHKHSDF